MQMLNSELGDLARQCALDRVDVRQLRDAIQGVERSCIEQVLDTLIGEKHYAQASALVLAASLAGSPVDASYLTKIVPPMGIHGHVIVAARSVTGDPASVLLDLWEDGRLDRYQEALIAVFVARLVETPPRRLIMLMRCLSRIELPEEVMIVIGDAARCINDPQLNVIARRHMAMLDKVANPQGFLRYIEKPVLELLPERAPRRVIRGRTIEHDADKIGRNDPCPCGSDLKYKRCCLRNYGGNGAEAGWARKPPRMILTQAQLTRLLPHEVAALDLDALSDQDRRILFDHLMLMNGLDTMELVLESMKRCGQDDFTEYHERIVRFTAMSGNFERAERLAEGLVGELPEVLVTQRLLRENEAFMGRLEEISRAALQEEGDGGVRLAFDVLQKYPAMGILVGRGAMVAGKPLETEMLAGELEVARDQLELPPHDPAQRLLDLRAEHNLARNLKKSLRSASTTDDLDATRRAHELQEKFEHAREERDELQRQLRDYEKRLEQAEAQPKPQLQPQANLAVVSQTESVAVAIATDSSADLRQLRRKIEGLKGIISEKNEERALLRQHIAKLEDQVIREPVATIDDPDPDPDDLAGLDEELNQAACLVPVYGSGFYEATQRVPLDVVQRAVRTAGELATSHTSDWTDVKRLRVGDVFTRRVGQAWRMFFRIHPAIGTLEVLELVARQDFERTLKRYRS